MEDIIQKIVSEYGINGLHWPDNHPIAIKRRELIHEWHKKPVLEQMFAELRSYIEKTFGRKVQFIESSPTYYIEPYFGYYFHFVKEGIDYHVLFVCSILAPYYCFFVKSHKELLAMESPQMPPKTPKDWEDASFMARVSQVVREKRIQFDFFVDKDLTAKLSEFDNTIEEHAHKYLLSVTQWHGNFVYKFLKTHADRYLEFEPTCMWNETPEIIKKDIEQMMEIQKKYFDFELLPKEFLTKEVPEFAVDERDKTWIPNGFQLMFRKKLPESRVALLVDGGAL